MTLSGIPIPSDWQKTLPVTSAALRAASKLSPRASDIHMQQGAWPWYRQGGTFLPNDTSKRVSLRELQNVFAWVGACARGDWLSANDTTSIVKDASGARWRATVYSSFNNLHATFRLMPNQVPPLQQLGLPDSVRRLASHTSGLVIIAGVARSGRTTTLASIIKLINTTREANILTIEHPVEYPHTSNRSLIAQRDIEPSRRGSAIKTALNADVDVVMLGDCSTASDFESCLTLAAAGHTIFAATHALDSINVCEKIAALTGSQGQMLLSQSLKGIITQRLVPDVNDPRGCHAVAEVLVITEQLRPLLKPQGDLQGIRKFMLNQRMTIDHALADKCLRGDISEEAARNQSLDTDMFDSLVNQSTVLRRK